MKTHELFPTVVCSWDYPEQDEFAATFYANIFKYMTPDGFSSEFTGHVNIHHEESFGHLFLFATQCLKQYISQLNVDPEMFDLNIVKTWMNITKDRQTPIHSHADANYSFTYYINIPKDIPKPLRFYNNEASTHNANDGYYCMSKFNSSEWNNYNSYTWQFEPQEGQLFVFPANLVHDTVGVVLGKESGTKTVDELKQSRICIAGDFLLTYKVPTAKATGIQPVSNWRIFQ